MLPTNKSTFERKCLGVFSQLTAFEPHGKILRAGSDEKYCSPLENNNWK